MRSHVAALFAVVAFVQGGPQGLKGKPEDNPKAAHTYVSSLKWGDNLADSQTVYTQFVWGNNGATVKIVPVTNANRISWQSALADGGDGYFVAKITNVDNQNIGPLGLQEGANGYLWIGQLANGERGAAIYSIKKDGTIEPNPKKLEIGGFCPGQHSYAAVRVTDGSKCSGSFSSQSSTASNHPMIMFASMRNLENAAPMRGSMVAPPGGSGLWVSCLGGCCEVKITQD